MQTSLSSRHTSFRSKTHGGFTLVELLISLAIIGMIYATVLVNFSSFDSITILKSTAFEVAGTIREAQVLSISVLGVSTGSQNNFRTTYGVHFAKNATNYIIFRDVTPPALSSNNPEWDLADSGVANIFTYTLARNLLVSDICVKPAGATEICNIVSLDISFRRPEFAALFYVKTQTGDYATTENNAIESAKVKIKSTNSDNVWLVEIGNLGHISVKKETPGGSGG